MSNTLSQVLMMKVNSRKIEDSENSTHLVLFSEQDGLDAISQQFLRKSWWTITMPSLLKIDVNFSRDSSRKLPNSITLSSQRSSRCLPEAVARSTKFFHLSLNKPHFKFWRSIDLTSRSTKIQIHLRWTPTLSQSKDSYTTLRRQSVWCKCRRDNSRECPMSGRSKNRVRRR